MKNCTLGSGVTAGLDVGYGNVKVVGGGSGGAIEREVVMPAGALPEKEATKVKEKIKLWGGEEVFVPFNNEGQPIEAETWVAGADPADLNMKARKLTEDYPTSPAYHALYLAGLARLGASKIDTLVTGLPSEHYYASGSQAVRKKMVERMTGKHYINGRSTVEVGQCVVVPQPFGSFMAVASKPEHKRLLTESIRTVVVDPGLFSFDWIFMVGNSVHPETTGTSLDATYTIMKAASALLSEEHGSGIGADYIDRALRRNEDSVPLNYATQIPIATAMEKAAKMVAPRAVEKMAAELRAVGKVDLVILTGGGARYYSEEVRKIWPNATLMAMEDPVLGNARGYRAIAELYSGDRRAAAA